MRLRPEVIPDARRRRRAGGRVVRWLQFASAPLLLSAQIVAAKADDQIGGAAAGSHRAAEDAGLDLSIDREAFFRAEEAVPSSLFQKILCLIDDLRRRPAPA